MGGKGGSLQNIANNAVTKETLRGKKRLIGNNHHFRFHSSHFQTPCSGQSFDDLSTILEYTLEACLWGIFIHKSLFSWLERLELTTRPSHSHCEKNPTGAKFTDDAGALKSAKFCLYLVLQDGGQYARMYKNDLKAIALGSRHNQLHQNQVVAMLEDNCDTGSRAQQSSWHRK